MLNECGREEVVEVEGGEQNTKKKKQKTRKTITFKRILSETINFYE